jgi:TetR/AcrR family transcriptional regulator, transcriptional repressor for nem operon
MQKKPFGLIYFVLEWAERDQSVSYCRVGAGRRGMAMTKGQQTRRDIIEKAAPLFNQKGYEGTSLSDLMDATGLQKGGIYRHFGSKEELAVAAFDYSWLKAASKRLDGLDDSANAVDRLKKMIDNFVELRPGLVPGGCPLMNTAIESDDGNPVLRARAQKALQTWTSRLSKIVRRGIAQRQINSAVHPQKLSQLVIATLEGALLVSRLQKNRRPLLDARQHLDEYLEHNVRSKARRN